MKPAALTIGAAIAILSGTAGFMLGKYQNTATGRPTALPALPSLTTRPPSSNPKAGFKDPRADLNREPNPLTRFNQALGNLETWMNADPKNALDWLQSQQPSMRRNEIIRRALAQFAENDPQGASEWALANLSGAELNNNLIRIAEQWAAQNGRDAATWLSALPATKERDAAMEALIFVWAANEPSAALDFLKKTPALNGFSDSLRRAAFAGWAKCEPQNAVSASLESSRSNNDPAQFANTLANWATIDLAASSQWLLANVRDGQERALAIQELATIFASQSPDAGLAWLAKLNPGAERDAAVNQLASEWATTDPASAAKWAETQTVGNLSDDSVTEILHNFLASDSKSFESWRSSLPDGSLKTRADHVGNIAEGDEE